MDNLISVIVPVYNNEKFIHRCLSSICQNTYKNLDIIVVDDGSTDKSGTICDDFAKEDSRVRVFHQANSGVSKTRNLGISVAKGRYIAFIDSDDYVDDSYFEGLFQIIQEEDSDLGICSVAHVNSGAVTCEFIEDMVVNCLKPSNKDKQNFYELNCKYYLYGPVNKLYKSSIIDEKQLRFPIDTSYGEDLLFNFDYLCCCNRISYGKQPMYYYNHDNENSLSHKYRENLFENGIRLNNKIREYCKGRHFFTEEMSKYWAERVFDDAYNSLFSIWGNQCMLTIPKKLKRTKMIMNHPDVCEALKKGEYNNYSALYKGMIEKRYALLFAIICSFAQKFNKK